MDSAMSFGQSSQKAAYRLYLLLVFVSLFFCFIDYSLYRVDLLGQDNAILLIIFGLLSVICFFIMCIIARKGVLCLFLMVISIFLIRQINTLVDYDFIYFIFHQHIYVKEIESSAGKDVDFLIFKVSETEGFPSGGAWSSIVYDKNDELSLPSIERTPQWRKLHDNYFLPAAPQCEVHTRRLQKRFYYVTQVC